MQVGSVARTSIIWSMSREAFQQEEKEASLLNIFLEQGPGPSMSTGTLDGAHDNAIQFMHNDTCMDSGLKSREEILKSVETCLVHQVPTQQLLHRIWSRVVWGIMGTALSLLRKLHHLITWNLFFLCLERLINLKEKGCWSLKLLLVRMFRATSGIMDLVFLILGRTFQ